MVRSIGVLLLTAAVLGPGSAVAAAGDRGRPRALVVAAAGDAVHATLGSYCVNDGGSGVCADSIYPLPVRHRLEVFAGESIMLRTHDRAVRRAFVQPTAVRGDRIRPVGDPVRARSVDGHPRRFVLTLPDLGHADVLDVFVRYARGIGDADYWAGIRTR